MRHLSRINHVKEKNPKRQQLKKKKIVFKLQGCHIVL